jgi:hypothetical protein
MSGFKRLITKNSIKEYEELEPGKSSGSGRCNRPTKEATRE